MVLLERQNAFLRGKLQTICDLLGEVQEFLEPQTPLQVPGVAFQPVPTLPARDVGVVIHDVEPGVINWIRHKDMFFVE